MGGDEEFAFADPVCCPAEPRELQVGVEPNHHGIRHVAGAICRQHKPSPRKLPAHAGRAEDEQAPHGRHLLFQMLDGRLGGGVKLVGRRDDADLAQMSQVVFGALGGVVRQERVADAQLGQKGKKWPGGFEQRAAAVDRAVHVQGDVAEVSQLFIHEAQTFCGPILFGTI